MDGELEPDRVEPPTHAEAVWRDLSQLNARTRDGALAVAAMHIAALLDGYIEKDADRAHYVRELRILMTQVNAAATVPDVRSVPDQLKAQRAKRTGG